MVLMTLSSTDVLFWKRMNVVLHEFILDPGEIIAKDQPNQKLASLAKIYDLLPQREHLPKQGTMYCRMKMQQVLEIILALKHANKQEEIDAEYILELLEKLMQSLSASRKSLQQGGFQQDIYTNKESYGGIDPEHENRLLESEKVALKFFNMQKMLFLQRVHFAVKNQSQSLSMERKVLQLESIANSFKEHLDKDSFQEVSSRAASLYQTKNGKKELKPQNDVLQIMAIPTGDPLFIYNNIQLVIQQLERALIPPPPKPVSMESNDNDYGCIVFTKPKTKRKRKQVAPEVKDEIRALCLANKNSSIKKIKSLSPDVLGKFSDEQIRQQMRTLDPENTLLQRKKRKTPSKWTDEETNAVIQGYRQYACQYALIKKVYCTTLKNRDGTAIKDKIRNLTKKGILSE